jgi:hypothetical protein
MANERTRASTRAEKWNLRINEKDRIANRLLLATMAASAQAQQHFPSPFDTRGTPEDQRACNGDARRICRQHLPDDMAVLRCFRQNRPKLSRACRAVLEKYGTVVRRYD